MASLIPGGMLTQSQYRISSQSRRGRRSAGLSPCLISPDGRRRAIATIQTSGDAGALATARLSYGNHTSSRPPARIKVRKKPAHSCFVCVSKGVIIPAMNKNGRVKQDYIAEIQSLRTRLEEAEEALRAIRSGEVDALVVSRPHGEDIFQLKGAEHLYRVFVDTMNEGAATLTLEGIILYCNNRLAGMLGTSLEKVAGSSLYWFIPAAERSSFESAVHRSKQRSSEIDLSFKRENHPEPMPVHISLNSFQAQNLPTICMVAMDLTERKRASEEICLYQGQLRALASELALAEERERRRLAAELHDRIGQTLALTKIKLSGLLQSPSHSGLTSPLTEIIQMVDTTIQDTHSLIFEISPPVLYQVGFEAAVEWLAEHFQEQYGIPIQVRMDNRQKTLEGNLRIILFQAIRELLINVVKHANASRAKILLRCVKTGLRIVVQDDGSGFTPVLDQHQETSTGFGLFNIRERLRHLGGEIVIESSPGKGTRVTLTMPQGVQSEDGKKEPNGDKNSSGR
jgi:PAS domain S-box-containing protein